MLFPAKYQLLQDLGRKGLPVPPTLFLSQIQLQDHLYRGELNTFLNKFEDKQSFIIRSAVQAEDGSQQSFAGHFHSSESIQKSNLEKKIPHFFQLNSEAVQKLAKGTAVHLMIQPYIQAQYGGVIFAPWKYFQDHAVIEYSQGSAHKAVSGEASQLALISFNEKLPDLLALSESLSPFKKTFVELLKKTSEQISYHYDMEWVLNEEGELIILQVRPMSRALNALKSASKEEREEQEKRFTKLSEGKWSFDGFSESLGCLSPLSFSIFQKIYEESRAHFKTLGFQAEGPLFFARAQNGMIYVQQELQNLFFKSKNLMTPFWRSFSEQKELKKTLNFCEQLKPQESFDIKSLVQIFQYWQTSSVFYAMKLTSTADIPDFEVGEYECTRSRSGAFPKKTPTSWAEARSFLKESFLYELHLIGQKDFSHRYAAFLSLEELETVPEEKALQRYADELATSLLEYPVTFGAGATDEESKAVKISGSGIVKAELFVIPSPHQFRGEIPEGVILVAPFFDNDWVASLSSLAGVILEQGGHLSHSAIVARELNTPYFIKYHGACEEFKNGQELELDCGKGVIKSI